MNWQSYLRARTHDPDFLWKMVATVLLVGGLLGVVADALPRGADALQRQVEALSSRGDTPDAIEAFRALINDPRISLDQGLDALGAFRRQDVEPATDALIPSLGIRAVDPLQVSTVIAESNQGPEHQAILASLWQSLWQGEPDGALLTLAAVDPPRRFAHHAIGVFWDDQGDFPAAARAFEQEGTFPAADRSRKAAVTALLRAEDYESLARLRERAEYPTRCPRG